MSIADAKRLARDYSDDTRDAVFVVYVGKVPVYKVGSLPKLGAGARAIRVRKSSAKRHAIRR